MHACMHCPEGIVLATDTRETTIYENWLDMKPKVVDGIKKIYRVRNKVNVAIACWGLAEIPTTDNKKVDIISYLANFDRSKLGDGETVDSIADKLRTDLESISPPIDGSMGCHIAGFVGSDESRKPKLRHVFHCAGWHNAGEFTNENCHTEYHTIYGNKVTFRVEKDYPVLFNGDSLIANLLFNYAPKIEQYYGIIPNKLTLQNCEELAKMIIGTSIQRLDYFFDLRKFERMDKAVGGGIDITRITKEEFRRRHYKSV